jgi:predicted nucleotidyltransferase component of viral defense system
MIDRREIIERAGELSLRPDVVEKDYVLGWLLAGIARNAEIGGAWAFKGGTCLKKIHFETYRFSEDLDFTLDDVRQLDEPFLRRVFTEIAAWIYEQTGIEIPAAQLRFDVYANKRGNPSAEGRLYYRGPLTPRGSLPGIRLDLTADERVVQPPLFAAVDHPYSDAPPGGIRVRSYPFVEVFAEKVRALGDRGSPRDLYDVINLFRRDEARDHAAPVLATLRAKCAFKSLPVPSVALLEEHRDDLEADWSSMLSHQLPELPPFDSFWGALPEFFAWLDGGAPRPRPAQYRLASGEVVLRPVAGGFLALGLQGRPLETIRFAAANHLRVDLDYRDEDGRRSTRRIEPYSLRRTQAGEVVLHAERADGSGHRGYRVDRILGAKATAQTFVPRWQIELSPTGGGSLPISRRPVAASAARRAADVGGVRKPVRVYECRACGRRFERTSADARLRAHKNALGTACPGRSGVLVFERP